MHVGELHKHPGWYEGDETLVPPRATPTPLKRTPSAWDARARRTLEQGGREALEQLRAQLAAELADLRAYGTRPGELHLYAAADAQAETVEACDRALREHAAQQERQATARQRARDYAARTKRSAGPERLPDDWPALCKALALEDVLSALGASPGRGGWTCPTCGAERRSRKDHRAALYVDRTKRSYTCWACKFSGDQVDLAQAALGLELIEAARWLLGVA